VNRARAAHGAYRCESGVIRNGKKVHGKKVHGRECRRGSVRELGYVEGRSTAIEGSAWRFRDLVADPLRLEISVAATRFAAIADKKATTTVPLWGSIGCDHLVRRRVHVPPYRGYDFLPSDDTDPILGA